MIETKIKRLKNNTTTIHLTRIQLRELQRGAEIRIDFIDGSIRIEGPPQQMNVCEIVDELRERGIYDLAEQVTGMNHEDLL